MRPLATPRPLGETGSSPATRIRRRVPVGLTMLSFMRIDQRAINPASPGVHNFRDGPGTIHRPRPRRLGAFFLHPLTLPFTLRNRGADSAILSGRIFPYLVLD